MVETVVMGNAAVSDATHGKPSLVGKRQSGVTEIAERVVGMLADGSGGGKGSKGTAAIAALVASIVGVGGYWAAQVQTDIAETKAEAAAVQKQLDDWEHDAEARDARVGRVEETLREALYIQTDAARTQWDALAAIYSRVKAPEDPPLTQPNVAERLNALRAAMASSSMR